MKLKNRFLLITTRWWRWTLAHFWILSLLLTGCSPITSAEARRVSWVNASASTNQQEHDELYCAQTIIGGELWLVWRGDREEINRCMEARGYRMVSVGPTP